MFDERFARQYRYDPPPEFLLASTYTSIVRPLSGLNVLPPFPTREQALWENGLESGFSRLSPYAFATPPGLNTLRLGKTLNSLVRVTRRDS